MARGDSISHGINCIFAHYGIPNHIVSANGPQFVSGDYKNFCKYHGILHTLTPLYHPQCNKQVEWIIQSLKSAIKKGMEKAGLNLEVVIDFLSVYRNMNHSTTCPLNYFSLNAFAV